MKLRFNFGKKLRNYKEKESMKDAQLTSPSPPSFPNEISFKILRFFIRMPGATSVELEDPFEASFLYEEFPNVNSTLFKDRNSASLVCSYWNKAVSEISYEYLIIYSEGQLKQVTKRLESNEIVRGKRLGEWTTRIDFRIYGPYMVEYAVRLLQCTPNLMIYSHCVGPVDFPRRHAPPEIIDALVTNCSRFLQRVEWNGAEECPRYNDLARLCNNLSNLTTLKLRAIHSYPGINETPPPRVHMPNLKTLSLGFIPNWPGRPNTFLLTWDVFLLYISSSPLKLPSLERFECDIFPLQALGFFYLHGAKLRLFRTTSWSTARCLPTALAHCPNLQNLVISKGSDKFMELPSFHPAIRRICIIPLVEVEVSLPTTVYDSGIVLPLDTLLKSFEKMTLPNLKELRIRDSGSYSNLPEYTTWLYFWWIRWNLRGVHFCNKTGISWNNVRDDREALLDTVRC